MSNLKFTYLNPQNGTLVTKTPFNSTTRYTTPSICYIKNGIVNYVPLITPTGYVDIDGYRYSYDSSDPIYNKTLHCIYNNVEYVVPNKSEQLVTYDIPAGTYTPSAFETLVSTFVGYNSSRKVQYAYQVTVNNQTVQCAANTYIALQNCYNSPYAAKPHAVWFNRQSTSDLTYTPPAFYYNGVNTGFTAGKCYVTYFNTSTTDRYSEQSFNAYNSASIRVYGGIKFV